MKKVALLKPPEEKGKGLPSVSGPEYFGYAHPVVVKLLMVRHHRTFPQMIPPPSSPHPDSNAIKTPMQH